MALELRMDSRPTTEQRFKLLSKTQRRAFIAACVLAVAMVGNTLYLVFAAHVSGIGKDPEILPRAYQLMLAAHVTVGVLVFAVAATFVAMHLPRMYAMKRPRSRYSGLAVVAALLLLLGSGFFILSEANSRDNAWVFIAHQVIAGLIVAAYLAHRFVSHTPPRRRAMLIGTTAIVSIFACVWAAQLVETTTPRPAVTATHPGKLAGAVSVTTEYDMFPTAFLQTFQAVGDPDPGSPLFPSKTTTTTGGYLPSRILTHDDLPDIGKFRAETQRKGFAPSYFLGAQSCEHCHADIVKQWASSAHRFASFNNPFYRKAVELTRRTAGLERSQFCGGCHDPAIMLAGNMRKTIDPLTPESQAGLTCLACHAIDRIHDKTGNGNYNIHDNTESPYVFDFAKSGLERVVHDYVLKAKPTVHKRRMLNQSFRESEFCLSCHKVNLDVHVNDYHWLRGQDEYDAWQNSGFAHSNPNTWYEPPSVKQCQDCHMPLEPTKLGDVSAKGGKVRSHRFLAANTALPFIRGDADTLKRVEAYLQDEKVRVDVFALHREDGTVVYPLDKTLPALEPGELVQVDVVIRNKGVGHTFPGGTNDSNEGWVDFQASVGADEVFHSGAIGPDHQVDPAAHFFQTIFVDRNGDRITKRNATDIYAPVYAHVIRPSTSDIARYRFRVPDSKGATLSIKAALRWRKFNRTFTEFVYAGLSTPDLPITEIASSAVSLPIRSASPAATQGAVAPDSWQRFNDYGVGLFLGDDTRGALEMFKRVSQLQPGKFDGWLNQARAYLADGDLPSAERMLRRASEVAPDQPRVAFFWGQWLEKAGRLAEAVQAYQRTLQIYPDSRDTWSRLGRTYWLMNQPAQSIDAYKQVLRIDPEDVVSFHQLNLAYVALAATEKDAGRAQAYTRQATEAQKGFEKYKLDENGQKVTQRYRESHPLDNAMSQKIVVHTQEQAAWR
jgi:tetratricopeptide (TPR) repeat protein